MKTKSKEFKIDAGDAVLIFEDGRKRSRWPVGIVKRIIYGTDGVVRGAVLSKLGGDGSRQTIERPLQKLYPLEITRNDIESAPSEDQQNDVSPNNDDTDVSEVRDNVSEIDDAPNRLSDNDEDDEDDENLDTSIHRRVPKQTAAIIGDERRRQQQVIEDYDNFDEFDSVN